MSLEPELLIYLRNAQRSKYWQAYTAYVKPAIERLRAEYPAELSEFDQVRQEELALFLSNLGNDEGEWREFSTKMFALCNPVSEAIARYFKDHPTIHLPDFEEWDKQVNPNTFAYWRFFDEQAELKAQPV